RPLHLGCVWLPAYSRRIDEQFGPAKSHQPRSFRIPLVPADQYSQPANRCCNGAEPQVTRGEIVLLMIAWIVRDMHLAVPARQRAIPVKNHSRIVIQTRSAPLEDG